MKQRLSWITLKLNSHQRIPLAYFPTYISFYISVRIWHRLSNLESHCFVLALFLKDSLSVFPYYFNLSSSFADVLWLFDFTLTFHRTFLLGRCAGRQQAGSSGAAGCPWTWCSLEIIWTPFTIRYSQRKSLALTSPHLTELLEREREKKQLVKWSWAELSSSVTTMPSFTLSL